MIIIISMTTINSIAVADSKPSDLPLKTFFISTSEAPEVLPLLRGDYFTRCELQLPADANNSQLRFLLHFGRILKRQGQIFVKGDPKSLQRAQVIFNHLGMHLHQETDNQMVLGREPAEQPQKSVQHLKLAVGYKAYEDQSIDEDELLKNENISLAPRSVETCADKPRACANCSCGRKDNENQPLPAKQELVKSINEGKPVSGCGKCYLGDSFRCSSCPYQGMPSFKPGDKLKLLNNEAVVVDSSSETAVQVTNGKVTIEL